MQTVLKGDGQWNPLPCLFDKTTLLRDALADYYDYASPGDLVKSHDRFAVFSTDKRWVGDLTALQPGEGYLMRRMGHGNVTVKFFNSSASLGRRQSAVSRQKSAFSNPKAAANMTMIATIVDDSQSDNQSSIVNRPIVKVYIGDELVGMAAPVTCNPSPVTDGEAVYFLTIQSDKSGVLRFETEDGTTLVPVTDNPSFVISNSSFVYIPDAHVGSLKAPVVLAPSPSGEQWDETPSKILENDHIVIIRNGERYDVTGKKIDN
jgi:hypothetical protein